MTYSFGKLVIGDPEVIYVVDIGKKIVEREFENSKEIEEAVRKEKERLMTMDEERKKLLLLAQEFDRQEEERLEKEKEKMSFKLGVSLKRFAVGLDPTLGIADVLSKAPLLRRLPGSLFLFSTEKLFPNRLLTFFLQRNQIVLKG